MKYKLKHIKTGEEHLCDKVTIDGFDYYVSSEFIEEGNFAINLNTKESRQYDGIKGLDSYWKKVIATTDPNIDIPKVVDEVETLVNNYGGDGINDDIYFSFISGYNKSQETHPFSEEDVRFMLSEAFKASQEGYQTTSDEIIQLWKEQQPKIVYYGTN